LQAIVLTHKQRLEQNSNLNKQDDTFMPFNEKRRLVVIKRRRMPKTRRQWTEPLLK
jgi:hypothetical protein